MAKRFTDTDKWKNPAFRDMDPEYRWLWLYILDTCDAAGIWRIDFALASFCIGHKFNCREAEGYFEDKVIQVDHDKWFIPSFVTFQYGELNPESRPHLSVIKTLEKHGIDPQTLALAKGISKSKPTLKDKDKDKDKDQDRGSAEGETFEASAAKVYARYPRKLGKKDGIARLIARFKAGLTEQEALTALDRFIAHHKAAGTASEYLPYFSTWVGDLDDWLDPETGQAENFGAPAAALSWIDQEIAKQAAGGTK